MNSDPVAIGRYEVQGVLGRGAMGVVYLAMDPLLKRLVAIKTLRDAGEEDVAITMERFHREAEISARLNHPNIITVFDVGSDPKAGPFMAMEYIEGASLAAMLQKKLSPDTGMRLLIQGMSALMAAEQAGIIHRDVKSENMLVSKEGRLKLMDFGIARRDESRLTQAGMVFGTPSYTAPELLVGGEPSPSTDRYAFAVTAFEVFTGKLPFLGSSVASTLYKVVHEPPQIPEEMNPRMATVFQKALHKEPAERYPDLPSFLLDLTLALPLSEEQRARLRSMLESDELLDQKRQLPVVQTGQLPDLDEEVTGLIPTLANQKSRSGSPAQPFPKRRLYAGLAGVLVVALAGGGIAAWQLTHRPTHPVEFRTEPPGAEVFLNGQALGRTPLGPIPIRDDQAKGQLRLVLQGYETVQADLEADDKFLEYTLQRSPYEVKVATDPVGAEVILNGEAKGVSPLALAVPGSGAQELVLRLSGYEDWKLSLDRDTPFPVLVSLTPATFQASVTSEPKGAEVWVDGKAAGRTPLASLQVAGGGAHDLRLKLTGYEDWSGRLDKGSPLPRPIVLKPRLFKVEVRTEPAGAQLFLDDKPSGTSPGTLGVPVLGSHGLRIVLDGHEPLTVALEAGKALPNPVQLKPVKKAEGAKPKEEKKPGFWKRVFGSKKESEKKD